jgi:hypothetical protein
VLVRRDGKFVIPELLALNPENLVGSNNGRKPRYRIEEEEPFEEVYA